MAGLNKVMLIGRLGKDPEVISFENGGKKMTVTLATSERYRDRNGQWQDQTEWHNIVAWGNLANDIEEKRRNYIKGDLLFVEGKIKTRQYQDSSGTTKYITEIVAEKMNLISKSGQQSNQNDPHLQSDRSTSSTAPDYSEDLHSDQGAGGHDASADDLPF